MNKELTVVFGCVCFVLTSIGRTYDRRGIEEAIEETRLKVVGSGCEEHLPQLKEWLLRTI